MGSYFNTIQLSVFILTASFLFLRASADCIQSNQQLLNKDIRAVGEWQLKPWVVNDDNVKMKYDPRDCNFYLTIGGLNKSAQYDWKVRFDFDFRLPQVIQTRIINA